MSSPEHESFLQMKYQKEIDLGHISPAYKRSHLKHIIGPFFTAPLSVIDSAGKLYVIVDHSFPDHNRPFDVSSLPVDAAGKFVLDTSKTSINSVTDLENIKCDWVSFHDCLLVVSPAPPGLQAAVFYVESAFCNVPLHPDVCRFFVIRLLDKFHLDYCMNFGHSPSPAVWGLVADAMVWILKNHGVQALLKWVDDLCFFVIPFLVPVLLTGLIHTMNPLFLLFHFTSGGLGPLRNASPLHLNLNMLAFCGACQTRQYNFLTQRRTSTLLISLLGFQKSSSWCSALRRL
jgi:hypothetical protein